MTTTGVRFEHRPGHEAALGLGTTTPRLSWRIEDVPDGFEQEAAEIEVTRTPWREAASVSSVVIDGDAQVLVGWPLTPLAPRERVSVRVRVRGLSDGWGAWSDPAVAEAGLLAPADWGEAGFISPTVVGGLDCPAPALVASIDLPGTVRTARLHITAHGWYEAQINGQRVGDDWFGPGWTAYADRLRVYTYDVTALMRPGANRVVILLGNGWFRSRLTWFMKQAFYGDRLAALARLEVVLDDGRELTLGTDGTWAAHETHVLANELYAGETQDLRRPLIADDAHPVEVVAASLERLVAGEGPPVRVTEEQPVRRVWRSPSGKLLADFGQNLVGVASLVVRGLPAGHHVTLRHAEVLEGHELGVRPLRKADATEHYVVAGRESETLQPHFTFHGFRYVQIEGLDELDPADLTAIILGSALERTGWFECSDPLLNQLHSNVVWGMRGNFLDVPTDCPQRDERLGWTGDISIFAPTALFLHDAVGFLSSWLADLAAEQRPDGTVPHVVPDVLGDWLGGQPAAAWGDAAVTVPWDVFRASGDVAVLERQLPSMKAWVDRVEAASTGRLWLGGFQFGDWLDPDAPPENPADAKAPSDVVATACFFRSADLTSRACSAVGDLEGAAAYARLAAEIRDAFGRRFVTEDGAMFGDSATGYAQAIMWGLLDEHQASFAGERLVELVRLADYRVSTGFVGTPLICDALSVTGHADVAYRLLLERGCPSWLYPVTMGATTIWERWDSMLPDGTINPGEMTSFNHYALGAVADWMHRVVAGLSFDAASRTAHIAPVPGGGLDYAAAVLATPYGRAASKWRRVGDSILVEADVPVGLTGFAELPDGQRHRVKPGRHTWEIRPA